MSEICQQARGVLYIITCAARSAEPMFVQDFVTLAQSALWDVYVVATPQATNFINISLLEELTGHPIRTEYKHPDAPDVFPRADAIVVVPATFNTINKWALGITDTLALGLLCEYMGLGMPIITIPCVPLQHLARHPAFSKNIALLKECGVNVIYEPQKYPPMNNVPWEVVLHLLNELDVSPHLLETREQEEVY